MAAGGPHKFVLDTNCFVDASRGDDEAAALAEFCAWAAPGLYLSTVVAAELNAGAGSAKLRQTLQRQAHLLLIDCRLRLNGDLDDRLREADALKDDRVLRVTQRLAGEGILQPERRRDITRTHLVNVLTPVGEHPPEERFQVLRDQEIVDPELDPGTIKLTSLPAIGEEFGHHRTVYDRSGNLLWERNFYTKFYPQGNIWTVSPDMRGKSPADPSRPLPPLPPANPDTSG